MQRRMRSVADRPAVRYGIYLFVFLMALINYGDRAALSVALPSVNHDFGLSPRADGWLLSAFFWSYFLLNLPASLLLDRFGPKRTGAVSVALWSCAMVLAGLSRTLRQLVVTRVLLGAGEAPAISLGSSVISRWAPPGERGIAMTSFMSGSQIGMAFGVLASGFLVSRFGWRSSFTVLGVLGLVWAIAWFLFYRDPRTANELPAEEGEKGSLSIPSLFRCLSFWGLVGPQVSANYANFLLLAWLPSYLLHVLHSDILHSGVNTAICYVSAAILSIVLGRIGEKAVTGRRLEAGARRYVVATFLLGAAVIGFLPLLTSPILILLLLAVCMACIGAAFGSNTALLCDLIDTRRRIGSVSGVILTFSNGFGLLAPIVTGYIVQATASFASAFFLASFVLCAGSLLSLLAPRKTVLTRRLDHSSESSGALQAQP